MTVSLYKVRLSLAWDLDGDTRYEGSPRYFYCDTGSTDVGFIPSFGSFRARYGAGFALIGREAAGLQCRNFLLEWGLEQVDIFCLNCDAPTLPLPWFRFTGAMVLKPYLVGEVLYAGQWWQVPWNWLEDE